MLFAALDVTFDLGGGMGGAEDRGAFGALDADAADFFLTGWRRGCVVFLGRRGVFFFAFPRRLTPARGAEDADAEDAEDAEDAADAAAAVASGRSKFVFHTMTISSLEPEAKYSPPAENPTALAAPVWPWSVYNKCPSRRSMTFKLLSVEAEIR